MFGLELQVSKEQNIQHIRTCLKSFQNYVPQLFFPGPDVDQVRLRTARHRSPYCRPFPPLYLNQSINHSLLKPAGTFAMVGALQ